MGIGHLLPRASGPSGDGVKQACLKLCATYSGTCILIAAKESLMYYLTLDIARLRYDVQA